MIITETSHRSRCCGGVRACVRVTLAGVLSAHRLDDSLRPVRLRKVVLGYPTSEQTSEFRFDLTLNYKLAGIIQTYSDQKPTLVVRAESVR